MPKPRNKAAKIRALLAENSEASAREVVETLAAQRVRVSPAQVYNAKAGLAKPKDNGYAALIKAKRLADAMGGVEEARRALEVLARLV